MPLRGIFAVLGGVLGCRFLQVSGYHGHDVGKEWLFWAVLNCVANNDNLYYLCCFFDTISLKPLKSSENSTLQFVNVFLVRLCSIISIYNNRQSLPGIVSTLERHGEHGPAWAISSAGRCSDRCPGGECDSAAGGRKNNSPLSHALGAVGARDPHELPELPRRAHPIL